jgi:ferredoxin-NADP reductase
LEFTKKLTESDFSKKLDNLKAADQVTIQYPFGKFVLDEASLKIAFLSGGIGITPIRSICKYVVDKNLGTDIVLVYANRSVRDVVFKEDFDVMMRSYPALRVAHVLCETEPGFKCTVGRINREVIINEIPDYQERKFYLCGPPQMVEAMSKILTQELGLAHAMIITENFQGY